MTDPQQTPQDQNAPDTTDPAAPTDGGNGDGTTGAAPPAWTAQLPDDLKSNETLTGFQTIGDLGKEFIGLRGKLENAVILPGEDASDDEWATFYQKLGRPESPDGYEFQRPDDLPEDMPYDEEREKDFRKLLYEIGATKSQADRLYKAYYEDTIQAWRKLQDQRKAYHDEQVTALQEKWGDQYQANAEKALRVAAQFGPEGFDEFLDTSGLGDNPMIVEFCHAISEAIGDDSLLTGDRTGGKQSRSHAAVLFPEMPSEG